MKKAALVCVGLALTACGPPVPDSGAGVGFDTYGDSSQYRTQRDAELNGQRAPATTTPATATSPNDVVNDPAGAVDPGSETAAPRNTAGISDENDFGAVSNRQSIESDAERLRRQAAAYEVIEPTALPSRSGAGGPNIVQYAITTRNPVGQKIYRRSALGGQAKFQRNCAKYASADRAQQDFLAVGGPQKDRKGLDPDGDGYACFWDPTPFRAVNAAANSPDNG